MTTEPTEEETRQLLAKAAATIDVDESAPITLTGLPEPRPRRWPVLAAAAAVVLAIGGGYLVSQQLGDDPQPSPVVDQTDAADREPVEQEHVYADDELPSLLGYTEQEARDLLMARGLQVRTAVSAECAPPGLVVSTSPGPGTRLTAGETVQLRIPSLAVRGGDITSPSCDQVQIERVGELIRFARGLGPAPAFPEEVSIAVGEGEYVALTAEEAADPQSWVVCDDGECHSPLASLAEILSRSVPMDDFNASTSLAVVDGPSSVMQTCLTPAPLDMGLRYHLPTYLHLEYPVDGTFCEAPVIQIEWTEDRRIAVVRLRLAVEGDGVVEDPSEPTAQRQASAEAFVAWARGTGPAPQFADRVRVMWSGGSAFGSTGWVNDPEVRALYSGCSGLGFPDCGADPVAILYNYQGEVVATAGRSTCADGGEVPTRFADATHDVVRLEEPEPASCAKAWAVELWIDEDGVIYGVNQAGGLPVF
jgi:hypothetical protein